MRKRFLNGNDYPELCDKCKSEIDLAVQICEINRRYGPDEEFDSEAPCMYVYDHRLFCGAHECVNRVGEEME
jgi:hypothetical protein